MNFLFLPVIICLGILVAIDDMKRGKIPNKYIIAAFGISIIFNTLLFMNNQIFTSHLFFLGLNVLFAGIIGFTLWYFNLWGAGDAKLLTAFVALIPLHTLRFVIDKNFPLIDIAVNVFLPACLFLVVLALIKSDMKSKKQLLKESFMPKDIMISLIGIFSVSWLTRYILTELSIYSRFLNLAAVMLGIYLLRRVLKDEYLNVALAVAVFRIALDRFIFTSSFLKSYAFLAVFYFTMILITKLTTLYTRPVKITDLKEGMVPTPYQELTMVSKVKGSDRPRVWKSKAPGNILKQGLNKQALKWFHGIYYSGELRTHHLLVQETISFAPAIFLGVLLTVLLRGNIILFLKAII
ncbi:prepilin peptidase [Thermoproteota archaeon]